MKLHLTRKIYTTNSTIGELLVDGKFQCFTLEDPVRPAKVKGITAIPAGTYKIVITHSAKFGRDLPLLENVPNYEGIRIHPGNTAEHTEGCLLVGRTKAVDSIGTSKDAFNDLFGLLRAEIDGGGKVSITIVEGGVSPFMTSAAPIATKKGSSYRVTADPLRIRSSADSTRANNIVGRLPFGLIVTGTGRDTPAGWVEVDAEVEGTKLSGFVSGTFLETLPENISGATASGPKAATPTAVSELFRVNASTLNLRKQPAALGDDSIIASLPRNHLVQKLATTKQAMWWEVSAVLHGETQRGFVNSGFLVPESSTSATPVATSASQPAAPATGEVTVSEKALQLILDFEGMDQPSKWPGQASGISLGHGYDLGYHTHDEFMGDWGPHLSSDKLASLATAIGKRGVAAKNIASRFTGITITKKQADAVFMVSTVPKIKGWALRSFPGILSLPPDAQGALTSLVYNRGTDMEGDRRKEMRDVRDTVAKTTLTIAKKLTRIAASIREMKRHWPSNDGSTGHPGIRRRREAEAVLVEKAG